MATRIESKKMTNGNQKGENGEKGEKGEKGQIGAARAAGFEAAAKGSNAAAGFEAAAKVPYETTALAYARVRPEIEAMPAAGLGRITVAIPAAVLIGLGALPNIEAKKEELRALLPRYDVERAGRLSEYAYAAAYAHYRVMLAAEGDARLRALLDEAGPLRERLLRSAELHAHYGALDPAPVAAIRSGNGHLDTANDLNELAMLFRASKDKLAGQTPVTDDDIARAHELGAQLLDALGRRRVGTDGASTPSREEEERLKAFWLFHGVYEESRRAMTHLRWYEGDADRLVPSLFLGRRRSPAGAPGEAPTPDEPGDEPGDEPPVSEVPVSAA